MKNIISMALKLLIIVVAAAIALGAVNFVTEGPIAGKGATAGRGKPPFRSKGVVNDTIRTMRW